MEQHVQIINNFLLYEILQKLLCKKKTSHLDSLLAHTYVCRNILIKVSEKVSYFCIENFPLSQHCQVSISRIMDLAGKWWRFWALRMKPETFFENSIRNFAKFDSLFLKKKKKKITLQVYRSNAFKGLTIPLQRFIKKHKISFYEVSWNVASLVATELSSCLRADRVTYSKKSRRCHVSGITRFCCLAEEFRGWNIKMSTMVWKLLQRVPPPLFLPPPAERYNFFRLFLCVL